MQKDNKKIIIKILNNKGKVLCVKFPKNLRSFPSSEARKIKSAIKNGGVRYYIKVTYGKQLDIHGKMTMFYNDGFYDTWQELRSAAKAFLE